MENDLFPCVQKPLVAIVILNWHNAPDTIACLQSLQSTTYPNYKVLVVDNGSTDDSVARIQDVFPNVEILQTGQNLGYAGGNNVAIRESLARGFRYIGIINNDAQLSPDAISCLIQQLETNIADVVTPLIVEFPQEDVVWSLGSKVDDKTGQVVRVGAGDPIDLWHKKTPFTVDAISGAMFVARRDVFETVGLLDENFFLYYEEIDWSLRVQLAGYTLQAVPQAIVGHQVSATLGTTSPLIDYYMLRNHLYLISKHWAVPGRWRMYVQIIARNLLTVLAFTVKPHGAQRLPNRDARLLALRDAVLGRWGKMGTDVEQVCYP